MSRSKFDRLIDQFYEREGNPRTQQVILRQIIRMHDPQAIPELLAIYKRKDAPAGLRRIAGEGLSEFWQLNQRVSQGARGARLAELGPWLKRTRLVLAALLVVTLIINGAILVARSLPAPLPPTQTVPSSVSALNQLYTQRIADGHAVADNLRLRWQEVQSQIKVNCAALPAPSTLVTPAAIDLKTYPGIQLLTTDLNSALSQINALQAGLAAICAAPTDATIVAQSSGDKGPAGQIEAVDTAITGFETASSDLMRWLAAPIPSATPVPATATSTAAPTDTTAPATALTPTASPTNAPTQTTSPGSTG